MNHHFPLSKLAAAITLSLIGSGALAQTAPIPNAGQVLRELPPTPDVLPAPSVPLQRIDKSDEEQDQQQGKVMVKRIVITGNEEIATERLEPIYAALIGTERSLKQLNAVARRITAYYRAEGYAVARAYLPAQDITDGTITINVMEGRISSHKTDNRSRLSDARAEAYLDGIKDGDTVKSAQIDRGLLLLQDTPGVGASRATLQPGASVGTSELLVELSPAAPYNGSIGIDNYGSRYTGEYRLNGNINLASPLGIGDQLSFGALISDTDLRYGRLAYQLPIGNDGLRVGVAYFDLHYKLGKEFKSLEAHGTASSTSIFASYPLLRSQLKNLYVTASYEDKRLDDRVDATLTATPKKTKVTTLGLSGNLQDMLGGGGINTAELSAAFGKLEINSQSSAAIDALSAKTAGNYQRFSYTLRRLQRLGDNSLLSVSVNGQLANKNLDSSEKFTLGGPTAVRAYPVGEATGDEGYQATVELRHNFLPALQGTVFYDMGQVTTNKEPFGVSQQNKRDLSGAGIGVNANIDRFQIRASVAWRTGSEKPNSIPASAVRTPTIWIQAMTTF